MRPFLIWALAVAAWIGGVIVASVVHASEDAVMTIAVLGFFLVGFGLLVALVLED